MPKQRTSSAILVLGLCGACVLLASPCAANEAGNPSLWSVGADLQGVVDFEPGNDYVMGFDAGYSDARVLNHRLELRLTYLTSRPEASFRNVLKQDWFMAAPIWHFRPRRLIDPTLQLNFGYQRYDVENEAIFSSLQNTTWVYGAQAGFAVNFGPEARYSLRYAFGYQQATSQSNFVFPLPFNVGVSVAFP